MLSNKKKNLWIIGILTFLIISIAGLILFNYWNSFYIRDYFAAIGIRARDSRSLIEVFGEPKNTNNSILQYEGIGFVVRSNWRNMPARDAIFSVNIVDSEIRFGRRNIGIGSTREEVKHAYRRAVFMDNEWGNSNVLAVVELPLAQFDAHIYNGGIWIFFHFDESDKVEKIIIDFYFNPA